LPLRAVTAVLRLASASVASSSWLSCCDSLAWSLPSISLASVMVTLSCATSEVAAADSDSVGRSGLAVSGAAWATAMDDIAAETASAAPHRARRMVGARGGR